MRRGEEEGREGGRERRRRGEERGGGDRRQKCAEREETRKERTEGGQLELREESWRYGSEEEIWEVRKERGSKMGKG